MDEPPQQARAASKPKKQFLEKTIYSTYPILENLPAQWPDVKLIENLRSLSRKDPEKTSCNLLEAKDFCFRGTLQIKRWLHEKLHNSVAQRLQAALKHFAYPTTWNSYGFVCIFIEAPDAQQNFSIALV